MTTKIVATITGDRISAVIDNRFRSYLLDSPQGKALAEAVKRDPQDLDEIRAAADVASFFAAQTFGRVVLDDRDRLRLDGRLVDFGVLPTLKRMIAEGFDVTPLAHFVENIAENPEEDIAADLFAFISAGNLPLTEDGCFHAFKRVNDDYYDFFSRTVKYPLGGVVEMPRENCAKHRTACGTGLHACYFDYLPCFHNGQGRILIVKINPKDVTDIPRGGTQQKLKACKMIVVGEIPEADARNHFTSVIDKRHPVERVIEGEATAQDGVVTTEAAEAAEEAHSDIVYTAEDENGAAPQAAAADAEDAADDTPVEVKAAYTKGLLDGGNWALGDTIYDADPSAGDSFETVNATQDVAQINAYKQGFAAGYDLEFKTKNG